MSTVTALHPTRHPEWTFGDRVRKVRRMAHLNQQDFGTAIGVTAANVDSWESDRHKPRGRVSLKCSRSGTTSELNRKEKGEPEMSTEHVEAPVEARTSPKWLVVTFLVIIGLFVVVVVVSMVGAVVSGVGEHVPSGIYSGGVTSDECTEAGGDWTQWPGTNPAKLPEGGVCQVGHSDEMLGAWPN
jgi:DNA-binding XRE family transcriptional regulator